MDLNGWTFYRDLLEPISSTLNFNLGKSNGTTLLTRKEARHIGSCITQGFAGFDETFCAFVKGEVFPALKSTLRRCDSFIQLRFTAIRGCGENVACCRIIDIKLCVACDAFAVNYHTIITIKVHFGLLKSSLSFKFYVFLANF